jgi:hypothetical protein
METVWVALTLMFAGWFVGWFCGYTAGRHEIITRSNLKGPGDNRTGNNSAG